MSEDRTVQISFLSTVSIALIVALPLGKVAYQLDRIADTQDVLLCVRAIEAGIKQERLARLCQSDNPQ
jgi:hypothetical protein